MAADQSTPRAVATSSAVARGWSVSQTSSGIDRVPVVAGGQCAGAVQAGAQGEHKLARGYEPVITRSAHFLPNPGFRRAVSDFVDREREAIAMELEWARDALPYKVQDQ